jgi:ribosomal-protein-serine acetyltransferase
MRIELRPPRLSDAPAILDAVRESRAELSRWMTWCQPKYGLAEARAWIRRAASGRRRGTAYEFVIVDADAEAGPRGTDRILGSCGLNQIRPADRLANLGYWVRTSEAGRGIATSAVLRVAEFAFRETDLARLEIVVAVENAASQRVARKVGAIVEGVARDRIFVGGQASDAAMNVLLRSRWKDVAAPGVRANRRRVTPGARGRPGRGAR